MLDQEEFLIGLLGPMLLSAAYYAILKRRSVIILPPGALESDELKPEILKIVPGTKFSRYGLLIGLTINAFMIILSLFIYANEELRTVSWFLLDLPSWMNWVGIGLFWIYYYWGSQVMRYNINYRPLYQRLPSKYLLATGGPYHIIRHPMYVSKILSGIFLFLASGIWIQLVGVGIATIALPIQARSEEELMRQCFGTHYQDYQKDVGRFFPKWTKKPSFKIFRKE